MSGFIRNKNEEITKDFTQAPNALWRLYTRLPNFKANHALMYVVLLDYHNADDGYAFPKQSDLSKRLSVGTNAPAAIAKVLKEYGLVDTKRESFGGNYRYYLRMPITDEDEFNAKFGHLIDDYTEKAAQLDKRDDDGKKALDELKAIF
jgi:hypothetical protein